MSEPIQYLTTTQASKFMGVSISTVREYCRDGTLPGAIQVKGRWKIPVDSVNTWLKTHNKSPTQPEKQYSLPSAWLRFIHYPLIFYSSRVFAVIAAILALLASGIAITGGWDDALQVAKDKGILLFFPKAREGEILIIVSEFKYSENLINYQTHDYILDAIKLSTGQFEGQSFRLEIYPVKLDSNDIQVAQKIGERYRANLIIWGEDTGARVIVNFLNIRNPEYIASKVQISEGDRIQPIDPKEYLQFITDDLPAQLSSLSLLAIGQTYYWANQYDFSITALESALSYLEKHTGLTGLAEVYRYLGYLYLDQSRDLDLSINYHNRALELDPQNAKAYTNRGAAWYAKGDFERAIQDLSQALELDPQNAPVYYYRGITWYDKGDLDRAIQDYTRAIELDPQNVPVYYYRGLAWSDKGDLDRALQDFNQALELDPQDAYAYANRGGAWYDQGDLDRAIQDYTRAIELDPQLADAYYNRGLAWSDKGDLDWAIQDYTRALELNTQLAEAYNNRGIAWLAKGDLDQAIQDYNQALELDPQFAAAYNNRGLAWSDKGDLDRAFQDYTQALELDPQYATAYKNRGNASLFKGDLDRAIQDYTQAIELDPQLADAYIDRGNAWVVKGDLDQAIQDYTQAIELDPQLAKAYNNRGNAWYDQGDFDQAIQDYNQALELDPQVVNGYYNRGLAWRAKGNPALALADFRRYVELAPDAYDKTTVEQWISELEQSLKKP